MAEQRPGSVWRTIILPLFIGLLLILILICGGAGLYVLFNRDILPASTTVVMQATIEALQTQQAQSSNQQSLPTIIVVTATPSNTPPASPTPLPTFTPIPLPTSTPVPLPTSTPLVATHTPVPQGRTIIIVITPTSPPTSTPYPEAPIIVSPFEGAVIAKGREILLHWSWNGVLLGPDELYEVKIRPDGNPRSAYIGQERGLAHNFTANLGGGRYFWTVQVVQGYWKNNSGHPDDWVFVRFRSPESEPRLIIVDQMSRNGSPRSQSQAAPPNPRIPYGVAVAGLAFTAFAVLARFTI